MTKDRILSLIIKRLNEELTSEEVLALDHWGNESKANRQFLDMVSNDTELETEIQQWRRINPSIGYSRWLDQMRGRQKYKVRLIAGWSVAASVIIVMGVIRLTRNASLEPAPVQPIGSTPAILPGRNTATLTLANGQQVSLDSATGKLAMQGNSQVVKIDSGSLAYTTAAFNKDIPITYNVLTTPRSGQYQILLPDGSHVWLNNLSSLRYPTSFYGRSRRVELTGEGYFEIAKDPTRPFVVSVNGEEVEVLGTSFNIKAYPDEESTQTTLLTGAVRVRAGHSLVELRPDEQAEGNGKGLKVLKDVPSQDIISWKNGFFYFGRASFAEVMRQLARWYDVDVKYEGPAPDLEFGGKIDRNLPLNDLLQFLDKNKVHFRLEGRTLIVLPS